MVDAALATDIQSDLRLIISEALQRKAILHVKDRAERAVSSLSLLSDDVSWEKAVEDVLSSLLIATEIGTAPKLILHSLSILQRLAGSGCVDSNAFSHMITVLCKATWSVSSSLSVMNPISVEVELAQIKCLQTLSLFQTDQLSEFLLADSVALGQVVSVCTNLINNPFSTPTVVQTSSATIRHLALFLASRHQVKEEPFFGEGSILNAQGQVVGVISSCKESPFLLFVHDLITMSFPMDTEHVGCPIFGSARIDRLLAMAMLGECLPPNSVLISQYLVPLLLRRTQDLIDQASLQLIVALSRTVPMTGVLFFLCNMLPSNFPAHSLVTDSLRLIIANNSTLLLVRMEPTCRTPMGNDSPHQLNFLLGELLICKVCQFIHQPDDGGLDESTLSSAIALMTCAVDELCTLSSDELWNLAISIWPSVLSCLSLILQDPASSVSRTLCARICLQNLLKICRSIPEAVEGIINTALKLSSLVSVSALLIDCPPISLELWRRIVRNLEKNCEQNDHILFKNPPDAVLMVQALLSSENCSSWQLQRVGLVLTSGQPEAAQIWQEHVAAVIATSHVPPTSVVELIAQVAPLNNACSSLCIHSLLCVPAELRIDCLSNLVASVGHLWDAIAWHECLSVLTSEPNGKLADMIVDEFLGPEILGEIGPLISVFSTVFPKLSNLNLCFKYIASVLKCIEFQKAAFLEAGNFFKIASVDPRADVRNCAIKTLAVVPIDSVLEVLVHVFRPVSHTGPFPDEVAGLVMHHSRDSEEKRWNETKLLALQTVFLRFRNDEFFEEIFTAGWTSNVVDLVAASCKLVPLYSEFSTKQLPLEIARILSDPVSLPLSTRLFVPYWCSSITADSEEVWWEYFSAVARHPSVYIDATPYVAVSGASDEVEPYRNMSRRASVDFPFYESERSILSPFLSSITDLTFLKKQFGAEKISKLFLDPNFLFNNSFTVELAIRCLSAGDAGVLAAIANTRNGPLAVASSGLWQLALQALVTQEGNSEYLFELLANERWDERGVDVLDYLCVLIVCRREARTNWISKEIEKISDFKNPTPFGSLGHIRKVIFLLALQMVLPINGSVEDVTKLVTHMETSDDYLLEAQLAVIPLPELEKILVATISRIFTANEPKTVFAVLTVLNNRSSSFFVKAAWLDICQVLIPHGTPEVRLILGELVAKNI